MKIMHSAFLGLGLLLAVSAAQAQEPMKASIPFDFVVGDRVLPAGEYRVSRVAQSNSALSILREDGKAGVLTLTSACSISSGPSKSTNLVFHAIGGRYFLSQVWTAGYDQGRQLQESKAEIELAKNGTTSKDLVLAANRSH